MSTRTTPSSRVLSSRTLLTIMRAAWILLTLLSVVVWSVGAIELSTAPPSSCVNTFCDPLEFTADDIRIGEGMGLPVGSFNVGYLLVNFGVPLIYFAVAGFIFWRRSDDRMALLISYTLIFVGAIFLTSSDDAFRRAYPHLTWIYQILFATGLTSLISLFFLFPDGRFVPAWTRYLSPLVLLVGGLGALQFQEVLSAGIMLGSILLILGMYAQIFRYRRQATALQRQQTKWVIVGFATMLVVPVIWVYASIVYPPVIPSPERVTYLLIFLPIAISAMVLFPLLVAFSVLRYRLWDIDLLINKALVYGLLTLTLAAVYFGTIILLQDLLRSLTGQQSPLAVVLSTLTIAALFSPLRRRIQYAIDRRFYRRRYDAQQVLADFARTARDETDLDSLQRELLRVMDETMRPERTSVWIKPRG